MKYRVTVRQCVDHEKAVRIAEEIAKWSGIQKVTLLSTIEYKNICLKKEADEHEAEELKKRFENVGAVIILEPLEGFVCNTDKLEDDDAEDSNFLNRRVRVTPSFRLGVRAFHKMGGTGITSFISFVLCLITLIYVLNAADKISERNYKAIKVMETKRIEVPVPDTTTNRPCDTVYIIDGERFKKAD